MQNHYNYQLLLSTIIIFKKKFLPLGQSLGLGLGSSF